MRAELQVTVAGLSVALIVYGLVPLVRHLALRAGAAIAKPAEDRWGRRVITRFGGVAVFAGLFLGQLVWVPHGAGSPGFLLGSLMIFAVGLADDLRRLRPYTKLLLQLAAGTLTVMGGARIELIPSLWLSIPLSILWFILVINAFNLLDNMDGLAAGIGAIAALFCAIQAFVVGREDIVLHAAVVMGACLGFLRHNFPPAKIYMGDAGSHLLGLNLGVLALMGSWRHSTQLLSILAIPLLVLAVPIFDTCFVTLQRLLHRRHPFQGGTDHVSHRLMILGLSQRQTVLILYAVGVAFGLLSLATLRLPPLATVVLGGFALTGLLVIGAFLARVNVYALRRENVEAPAVAAERPATLIETMLLHKRRLLEVLVDFALICGAYAAAHLLRFEGTLDAATQALFIRSLPIVIIVKLLHFLGFGLYRGVWKYVGLADLGNIFKAVTLGTVGAAMALLYLWRFQGYSRAVFVIDWLLLFVAVSAARVAERLFAEWITTSASGQRALLVIGAGDLGELVLRQVRQQRASRGRVVGFLDDDPSKRGSRIHGVPVLGDRTALARMIEQLEVAEVVVAIRAPSLQLLQDVEAACRLRGTEWHPVGSFMPSLEA